MTKQIKPSDLKDYKDIMMAKDAFSDSLKRLPENRRNNYGYYFLDGIWMIHRKPNVDEILSDSFK